MTYTVRAENGNSRECESRSEAEDVKADMERLGMTVEIDGPEQETDGGEVETKEPIVQDPIEGEDLGNELDAVSNKDITTDPLSVMPGHFVDTIQGVPTINRKGYAVLAEHFGVSVKAEPITLPSETDFEYAEFRAIATTEDGTEYSGFGSAHIDRMDGDDPHLLGELAETRALKRAVSWATGIGMTAYSEMTGEL